MTKKRSTKRALMLSALSLLLCVSMLVGSTFAWFTDSVTSGNNIIKSGNLDITLEYWNGAKWADVKDSTEILDKTALYEPGYVQVAYLKLENVGDLALQYQLGINIINEVAGVNQDGDTFKLSDYIYFGVIEDVNGETNPYTNRADAVKDIEEAKLISAGYTKATSMKADDPALYLALVVYMPETVGNEANHNGKDVPTIELGINAFATQYTYEKDSFDNKYDVGAPYALPAGVGVETFGENVAYCNGKYYPSLLAALEGIHNTEDESTVLYLKPYADLGTITHAHVCNNLTVYGNGAYISGGEGDFEVGQYNYCHNGANTCDGLTEDLTLNIYGVKGVAVWGNRTTDVTVNVNLYNCEDINRVYINGTAGINNINIVNSSFDGTTGYRDTAVYSNNPGAINLTNVTVKAYSVGMNINNKSEGVQNITLTDCTFIDCATIDTCGTAAAYAAPIRVVATEYASAVSNVAVNGCKFVYTTANKAIDGDILTLDKREGKANNGTVNVTVDGIVLDGTLVGTTEALQNAIKNAASGDKIQLIPNSVFEEVVLTGNIVDNLTIVGAEGAVVKGIHGANLVNVKGLTLKNIAFQGKGVYFDKDGGWNLVENLTMTECSFVGNGASDDSKGNRLFDVGDDSPSSNQYYNLVIENCTISNAIQGMRLGGLHGDNCIVRGNTITNVGHNAITIRSNYNKVLVEDNIITDGADRALRIGTNQGTVIYKNNVITHCGDDDGSNFKANTLGTVTFEGNIVDGAAWNPLG